MIAKIGRGENLYGALSYNSQKVDHGNGQVLLLHQIPETADGKYAIMQLTRSFEPYLVANRNTEKPVLHISLNPDPNDQVSDDKLKLLALHYMRNMGYGDQPFVVFKHTDTLRTHIHIVSVCVDQEGRKISDQFEKRRSMAICRELERKYGLIPATGKEIDKQHTIFQPVDYHKGDLKSQISAVLRYLPTYYRFQSLGEYNALLSLFNITSEQISGQFNGQIKQGLVYSALDEYGQKAGPPFKASLFGKNAGYEALDTHYNISKESLKETNTRTLVSTIIHQAMESTNSEADFKQVLAAQGINVVTRPNDTGRIYGVTFIDHTSKTVWNGSRLGKEFSANNFHEKWANDKLPVSIRPQDADNLDRPTSDNILSREEPHGLFSFLEKVQSNSGYESPDLIEILGSLIPENQNEQLQEPPFHRKKKKKNNL